MSPSQTGFETFFAEATGESPFPFQRDFAVCEELPCLVDVPTGLGKTAMAVVGWLWRRRFAAESVRQKTPRPLVYCLPMRVLVEQTRDNVIDWLDHLNLLAARGDGGKGLAPVGSCVKRYPQSGDEKRRARRGRLQPGSYEPPTLLQDTHAIVVRDQSVGGQWFGARRYQGYGLGFCAPVNAEQGSQDGNRGSQGIG